MKRERVLRFTRHNKDTIQDRLMILISFCSKFTGVRVRQKLSKWSLIWQSYLNKWYSRLWFVKIWSRAWMSRINDARSRSTNCHTCNIELCGTVRWAWRTQQPLPTSTEIRYLFCPNLTCRPTLPSNSTIKWNSGDLMSMSDPKGLQNTVFMDLTSTDIVAYRRKFVWECSARFTACNT